MKLKTLLTGITAAAVLALPVAASAGTRTSVASAASVSALPAVRPALSDAAQRRSSPVRRSEGLAQTIIIPIIIGGIVVGYTFYEVVINDSDG